MVKAQCHKTNVVFANYKHREFTLTMNQLSLRDQFVASRESLRYWKTEAIMGCTSSEHSPQSLETLDALWVPFVAASWEWFKQGGAQMVLFIHNRTPVHGIRICRKTFLSFSSGHRRQAGKQICNKYHPFYNLIT